MAHMPWAVAALLISFAAITSASLMAIDLGSEYMKVCLIKPGRTPISVVVNEMSKRKSPALVGFVNDERLVGEEAFSVAARFPELIFHRARDLLGKRANDSTITSMVDTYVLPYEIVDHPVRGVASVKLKDGSLFTGEELVASLFSYAKEFTDAYAGGPVLDTVIAVPPFFGQTQRQAIMDAAALAGLNVMGLMNTHAAAALQFGIERDFTNKTQLVAFYNMGSGSTEVALVKYSTYTAKEAGKPKIINQFEVKDVEWDAELGANQLDMVLARHFAKQFQAKHGEDIMKNPKAMAKMKKQVRRAKEVLSANSQVQVSVEELHDNRDFFSAMTREELEVMAGDFFERATAPMKRLLERNGLKPEELDAVELLGGGSRVPRLQQALSEAMGGRTLDKHLDADEAVVLGAALFAANLSASFRLRKFGMVDTTMYGVSFKVDEVYLGAGEPEEVPAEDGPKGEKNLLPYMKKLPSKRVVHYRNVAKDPIRFTLAYNTSTPHGLPPGVESPDLASFTVTGIASVIEKYNTSGQVNLRFEAEYSGLLRFAKAEAEVEFEVMEERIVEVKDEEAGTKNGTADAPPPPDSTAKEPAEAAAGKDDSDDMDAGEEEAEKGEEKGDKPEPSPKDKGDAKEEAKGEAKDKPAGEGAAGNGTDDKPKPKVKTIMVPKKKQVKVPLTVSGGWAITQLAGEALAASKKLLSDMAAKEAIKRDTAKAKNEYESYIINTRDALDSEKLQKVTTEEQRSKFQDQLTEAEDWLYMDGDAEDAPEYRKRLRKLKDVGDPMYRRADELKNRPSAVGAAKESLELKRKMVNSWPETKPWLNDTDVEDAAKGLAAFEKWLDANTAAQSKKADHEDPAFTVAELSIRQEIMEKIFNKVNNKKKPKPPPAPPPPPGANATDAPPEPKAAGDSTDSGEEPEDAPAPPPTGAEDLHEDLEPHDELRR